MVKGWKMVGTLALIMVGLGAVLVAVGYMTGADMARIFSVIDNHYLLTATYQWVVDVLSQLFG